MCIHFVVCNTGSRRGYENSCCLLVDKEEIGSTGASGMTSRFFENAVAEYILLNEGIEYNDIVLRRTLANSKMLSSDVSAGFDPMYEDVYEKKNAAFLACGPVFNKYTGSEERAVPMMPIRNTWLS